MADRLPAPQRGAPLRRADEGRAPENDVLNRGTSGWRRKAEEVGVMPARRATCVVISPDETFHGKQDLDYFAGISAESAGSTGLCMHLVTIPPQARATPSARTSRDRDLRPVG